MLHWLLRGLTLAAIIIICTIIIRVTYHPMNSDAPFALTSSAFTDGGSIPPQYTCDGANTSPPLTIAGVPAGAKSLALVVDDPDIPQEIKQQYGIEVFDHWVLYGIPPDTTAIPEGTAPGTPGLNGASTTAYTGPCPPTQYEPKEHRYIFTLYALSDTPSFAKAPTKAELLTAIAPITIAQTQLMGKYARQ